MARSKRATPEMLEIDRQFQLELATLIMMWANAESWFRDVLAVLLKTDITRATLIFSSLFSARARVELVERMGILCLKDTGRVRHLQRLVQDFKSVTKMRNLLCHSQYEIDSTGMAITEILSINFHRNDFDGTNYLQNRPVDRGLLNEIRQAHRSAVKLCGRLKRFVKLAPAYVLDQPRDTPLPLKKRRKAKGNPRRQKKV